MSNRRNLAEQAATAQAADTAEHPVSAARRRAAKGTATLSDRRTIEQADAAQAGRMAQARTAAADAAAIAAVLGQDRRAAAAQAARTVLGQSDRAEQAADRIAAALMARAGIVDAGRMTGADVLRTAQAAAAQACRAAGVRGTGDTAAARKADRAEILANLAADLAAWIVGHGSDAPHAPSVKRAERTAPNRAAAVLAYLAAAEHAARVETHGPRWADAPADAPTAETGARARWIAAARREGNRLLWHRAQAARTLDAAQVAAMAGAQAAMDAADAAALAAELDRVMRAAGRPLPGAAIDAAAFALSGPNVTRATLAAARGIAPDSAKKNLQRGRAYLAARWDTEQAAAGDLAATADARRKIAEGDAYRRAMDAAPRPLAAGAFPLAPDRTAAAVRHFQTTAAVATWRPAGISGALDALEQDGARFRRVRRRLPRLTTLADLARSAEQAAEQDRNRSARGWSGRVVWGPGAPAAVVDHAQASGKAHAAILAAVHALAAEQDARMDAAAATYPGLSRADALAAHAAHLAAARNVPQGDTGQAAWHAEQAARLSARRAAELARTGAARAATRAAAEQAGKLATLPPVTRPAGAPRMEGVRRGTRRMIAAQDAALKL